MKIYIDSRPLLETLDSTNQVAEKALRKLVAYLKQCLMDKEENLYALIEGKEILADVLTKQLSKRGGINDIMIKSLRLEKLCEIWRLHGEIKVDNLTNKTD